MPPRGPRAYGAVPRNHGTNTTLVAALCGEGSSAARTGEGALDTPACAADVAHLLAPTLRPGPRVILDHCAVHHTAAVRQVRAARSCRVRSRPSYSPLAHAVATIKAARRRRGARTREAVEAAIAHAMDHITPRDARGFFRPCGDHSPAQLL